MRYNLGYIDKYPIEAAGSPIENVPMYRVVFKRPVNPVRLEAAVRDAMTAFPLFATQVEFDREYYLRTNQRPVLIEKYAEDERPNTLGKNTNGYPWRIIYKDCTLCFEWLHGITDGMGAMSFLTQVLRCYFGHRPETKSLNFLVAPGLEPFVDRKEKGMEYRVDSRGFSVKDFPIVYKDYRTDCCELYTDTAEVVNLAHSTGSSVVLVLAILFSRAIRMHLPTDIKNRRVACNVAVDLRRTLHYETMHNCVDLKRVTYLDEYDNLSFTDVAMTYKRILDRARLVPNVIRSITERVTLFRSYHLFPSKVWLKCCTKIIGGIIKNTDCNFGITYPGKIDLPPEILENIENIDLKLWHDFGHCTIAAIDYNGRFNLNIFENFAEKGIVDDFIRLSAQLGIHWTKTAESVFQQTHFEE